MEGSVTIDSLVSKVISRVHTAGIPYPALPVTKCVPDFPQDARLLGDPMIEVTVNVENARGQKYDLIISQVIYSRTLHSYWFVYGFINETLLSGDPDDVQVLTFRWFQGRSYLTPLRLGSCRFLECELLGATEIAGAVKMIPAITAHRWIN